MRMLTFGFIVLLASSSAWSQEMESDGELDGAARLVVQQEDVRRLELAIPLEHIKGQIDQLFQGKESALAVRRRKVEAEAAFDGWRAAREELGLLADIKGNLDAIYQLNVRRQNEGEIEDTKVLESHNRVLEKQIALLQKREQARGHLLRLLEIALVEIVNDGDRESGTTGTAGN